MKPGKYDRTAIVQRIRGTAFISRNRPYCFGIYTMHLAPLTFISSNLILHNLFSLPDWDRLGSEYADSSVLIGDVDCTADGESLCEQYEVRGCKCN